MPLIGENKLDRDLIGFIGEVEVVLCEAGQGCWIQVGVIKGLAN